MEWDIAKPEYILLYHPPYYTILYIRTNQEHRLLYTITIYMYININLPGLICLNPQTHRIGNTPLIAMMRTAYSK